jgi:hypothetical protein
MSSRSWIAYVITISFSFGALPAFGSDGDGFGWSITPYIWATETKYDLTAEGTPLDKAKITFNDLLDVTDSSFQLAVEGGRKSGHFTGFVDVTYLETSDNYKGEFLRIDTDSEQWFIDAALAYWPGGVGSNLNVFGGARYTDLDDDFTLKTGQSGLELLKFGPQRDFLDALVGARYRFDLANRWALLTHADYAFGDSDGIFILQALLRFTLGENNRYGILLGYRYKEAEHEDGGLEEDYEYKGPVLGLSFRL